jgi:hypothetical protein
MPGAVAADVGDLTEDGGRAGRADAVDAGQTGARLLDRGGDQVGDLADLGGEPGQAGQPPAGQSGTDAGVPVSRSRAATMNVGPVSRGTLAW